MGGRLVGKGSEWRYSDANGGIAEGASPDGDESRRIQGTIGGS